MLRPQAPGLVGPPLDAPPTFGCPKCKYSLHISPETFDLHFNGKPLICGKCHEEFKLWDVILNAVRGRFMGSWFGVLGAKSLIFRTKLFLNTETRLNLYKEVGLPTNAVILDLNVTGHSMFCTEMHSNSRRHRNRGGKLQLFGFQTYTSKHTVDLKETLVDGCVTWIESSAADTAWNNLVSAFDAYADDDFAQAVIPANVAVEAKLFPFIERALNGLASKERIRSFLSDAATYGHQLNILLPLIVRENKLPAFDPVIIGLLNKLRDARNSLAHTGKSKLPLDRNQTAELLTAALFGFRYIDLLKAAMKW